MSVPSAQVPGEKSALLAECFALPRNADRSHACPFLPIPRSKGIAFHGSGMAVFEVSGVDGVVIVMYGPGADFPHTCMRWMLRLTGGLPV